MPHVIQISAAFPTTDNHREHARLIMELEEPTLAYEAALKEIVGSDVTVDIQPKRVKAPNDTATIPAPIVQATTAAPEPVSTLVVETGRHHRAAAE